MFAPFHFWGVCVCVLVVVSDGAPYFWAKGKQLKRSKDWLCFQVENFNPLLMGKHYLKFLNPILLAFKLAEIPS